MWIISSNTFTYNCSLLSIIIPLFATCQNEEEKNRTQKNDAEEKKREMIKWFVLNTIFVGIKLTRGKRKMKQAAAAKKNLFYIIHFLVFKSLSPSVLLLSKSVNRDIENGNSIYPRDAFEQYQINRIDRIELK